VPHVPPAHLRRGRGLCAAEWGWDPLRPGAALAPLAAPGGATGHKGLGADTGASREALGTEAQGAGRQRQRAGTKRAPLQALEAAERELELEGSFGTKVRSPAVTHNFLIIIIIIILFFCHFFIFFRYLKGGPFRCLSERARFHQAAYEAAYEAPCKAACEAAYKAAYEAPYKAVL